MTHPPATRGTDARWRPGVAIAALSGLVAVGLAVAVAELVAALGGWLSLLHPSASAVTSLGQAFIAVSPEWLKQWAIDTFGEQDKVALGVGMIIAFIVSAAAIGIVARRSLPAAVAVFGALIVVTAVAVLSRAGATVADLLPLLAGGAAGIWLLVTVFRREPGSALRGDAGFRAGIQRRQFLRITAVGALAAAAAGALGRLIPSSAEVAASRRGITLPAAADRQPVVDVGLDVDGITPFVTDNAEFYRIDTAFVVPRVTADSWQLRIHGLVDREISLSYADLSAMPSVERMITLTCVSNPVGGDLAGNARWQGVRIADVLAMAGPQAGADCLFSTSTDGFTVTTPLEAVTDGRDALLAFAMNGEPLPVEHGFPVRMVVPGLYGFVSATKWVVDLELTRFSEVSAYWTDRGWAPRAPIKTASRIDVPSRGRNVPAGMVTVAGMAWAQHRGISAVQVRIDDGEWRDAELSAPVSIDTWRQWVYRWDGAETGQYTVSCRAIDGTGTPQVEEAQGVIPDGATGLDSRIVTVVGNG